MKFLSFLAGPKGQLCMSNTDWLSMYLILKKKKLQLKTAWKKKLQLKTAHMQLKIGLMVPLLLWSMTLFLCY